MIVAPSFLLIQLVVLYWWMVEGEEPTNNVPARFLFFYNLKNPSDPGLPTLCTTRDITSTTTDCGKCVNVTSSGGVIQSPNFPLDYGATNDCVYYIRVESGKKIRLAFTAFVIRSRLDFIIVSEGPAPGGLDSINMNGYLLKPILTSSSNDLTIEFRSSGGNNPSIIPSTAVPSFEAVYTVVD